MCFTEVKISKKNYNFFHHKDYNTYHNLPDNHLEQAPKGGLIILVRKTLCNNQPTITHINPGKATTILFKFPNLTLKCYFLYAPSQDDSTSFAFYEDLFDSNPPDPTQNTIYIGDFNVVQNTTLDRKNHSIKYHTTVKTDIQLNLPKICYLLIAICNDLNAAGKNRLGLLI